MKTLPICFVIGFFLQASIFCNEQSPADIYQERTAQLDAIFNQIEQSSNKQFVTFNNDFPLAPFQESSQSAQPLPVPASFPQETIIYDQTDIFSDFYSNSVDEFSSGTSEQSNAVYETDDSSDMTNACIQLAIVAAYYGYQIFSKTKQYNFKQDVLDVPYKKMVYLYTQGIEQLFTQVEDTKNPLEQIRSLLLLCRMPVPAWYVKQFRKGLDFLYQHCFDEQGNFIDWSNDADIRSIFKDYIRKAPKIWQDIAKISSWWYKNKKAEPMCMHDYAHTYTKYNQDLLSMIQVHSVFNLGYLKNMVTTYTSKTVNQIYDYKIKTFLIDNTNEFGIWKRAELDPWWKNMSLYEKQTHAHSKVINEILMMRDVLVHRLALWMTRGLYKKYPVEQDQYDSVMLDALYYALPHDQTIFNDYHNPNLLRKVFIDYTTYVVEHNEQSNHDLTLTRRGILKKYELHPLVAYQDFEYDAELMRYLNSGLLLQHSCFDQNIQYLASRLSLYAHQAQTAQDDITKTVCLQCAREIFMMLDNDSYSKQSMAA